jgi:hypothetical protein
MRFPHQLGDLLKRAYLARQLRVPNHAQTSTLHPDHWSHKNGTNTQFLQMVQPLSHPIEVAHTIAIRVFIRKRPNLSFGLKNGYFSPFYITS